MTDNLFRCPDCPGQLETEDTVVFRQKVWSKQSCKDCGAVVSSWFHVDDHTRVKCQEAEQ